MLLKYKEGLGKGRKALLEGIDDPGFEEWVGVWWEVRETRYFKQRKQHRQRYSLWSSSSVGLEPEGRTRVGCYNPGGERHREAPSSNTVILPTKNKVRSPGQPGLRTECWTTWHKVTVPTSKWSHRASWTAKIVTVMEAICILLIFQGRFLLVTKFSKLTHNANHNGKEESVSILMISMHGMYNQNGVCKPWYLFEHGLRIAQCAKNK